MKVTMNKIKSTLVIAALIASALPVMAQRQRISPHETITASIDGSDLKLVYGRPYSKKPGTGNPAKSGRRWCPGARLVAWAPIGDRADHLAIPDVRLEPRRSRPALTRFYLVPDTPASLVPPCHGGRCIPTIRHRLGG